MDLQTNYYEVLGLSQQATTDEIKKKYRELARKYHPDLVEDKAMGQRVFSQINRAYRVLVDPDERRQYDHKLVADNRKSAVASAVSTQQSYGTATSSNGSQYGTGASAARPSSQVEAVIQKRLQDADTAIMQGDVKQAKLLCDNVLQMDASNVQALSILGDVLVQMRKPEEAAQAYRRAIAIAPSQLLQAKLDRIVTAGPAASPSSNGTRPSSSNGKGPASSKPEPPKPSGGFLSRMFGKS